MFVFGGQPKKTSELETPTLRKNTFAMYLPPSLYLYSLHSAFPPSIPKGFALGSDVDFAKECAKVVHYYRFVTEQIDRLFKLMHQAALCYRYIVFKLFGVYPWYMCCNSATSHKYTIFSACFVIVLHTELPTCTDHMMGPTMCFHCRYTTEHELTHVKQSMQSAEQLNGATCKVLDSQIVG